MPRSPPGGTRASPRAGSRGQNDKRNGHTIAYPLARLLGHDGRNDATLMRRGSGQLRIKCAQETAKMLENR